MKRVLALFICTMLVSPSYAQLNYDLLYKDTPVLGHIYETGVDEEEDGDYEDYIISPYVLVRLPAKLRNKKIVLNPGYYLVKPERKDGYRFAVFKQNGYVVGAVPVYQKVWVDAELIFPPPPKKKHKWYVWPFATASSIVKWPFKKLIGDNRKPKKPKRAKADFRLVGDGEYYDMWLYVENSLYKMLFKLEQ